MTRSFFFMGIFSFILLAFNCAKKDDSGTKDFSRDVYAEQVRLSEAKQWKYNKGGRSWTVEDELNYDEWVSEVPATILVDWDLPNDCADAALALRWIYAIQYGLALKFGKYNSTDYFEDPVEMLRLAIRDFGTVNLSEITYAVDMWDEKNYQGGNIHLLRERKSGHTIQLTAAKNNLLYKIESTIPAAIRDLSPGAYLEISAENMKIRRLFAIKREGDSLSNDKEISYLAHAQCKYSANPIYFFLIN